MKHIPTTTTQTYLTKYNFLVDIVTISKENYYEAWIYSSEHGIKDLMFGVPVEQQTYEEFLEIVFNNLDDYITDYVDEHFTLDERKNFYAYNFNQIK